MVYKWCIVPQCTNTSVKTPQKLFVSVPTNPKRRNKWLQLARRDPNSILSHTNVFMCEDHFDMEKDIINYMKYKMGFSSKILLTDEAMPSKFHCQEDRKRRLGDPDHQSAVISKRKRMELLKQFEEGSHVQSQDMTETVQKDDNIVQEAIEPDEDIQHERVTCSCCNSEILGNRYTCLQCRSVDLCTSCEAANFHPDHVVLRLPTPTLYETVLPCLEPVKKALGITLSNSPGTSSSRKSTQKTTSKEDKEFIEKDLSDSEDSNAPLTPALIKPSKKCSCPKSTGLKRVRNENNGGSKKRKGDNEINAETSGDNDQNISIKTEDRDTQPDGTAEQQSIEMVYLDPFMTNNQEVDETRDVITEDDIKVEIKTEDEFSAEEEKFTY